MFRPYQTKFQPIYARKCQKDLTKPQKRNLACDFKYMTIIFDSIHFSTKHIQKSVVCHVSCQTNQVLTASCEKVQKTLEKTSNLAHNF